MHPIFSRLYPRNRACMPMTTDSTSGLLYQAQNQPARYQMETANYLPSLVNWLAVFTLSFTIFIVVLLVIWGVILDKLSKQSKCQEENTSQIHATIYASNADLKRHLGMLIFGSSEEDEGDEGAKAEQQEQEEGEGEGEENDEERPSDAKILAGGDESYCVD